MSAPKVGDRVQIDKEGNANHGKKGTVRFGPAAVQFATGKWYGIELDEKVGKNNGTLKDVVYFSCPDKHGMFARAANVKLFTGGTSSKSASTKTTSKSPTKTASSTSPTKKVVKKTTTSASSSGKAPASPSAAGKTAVAPKTQAAPPSEPQAPPKAAPAKATPVVTKPATLPVATTSAPSTPASTVSTAAVDKLALELEAALLDKELAELHLEEVQVENDALRATVQDLQLKTDTGGSTPDARLSKALEAVSALREQVKLRESELSASMKVMRQDGIKIRKLEGELQKRTMQMDNLVSKVSGMKEQIEGTANSSDIIEALTNKTTNLEEQNKKLLEDLGDMKKMLALENDILEEHRLSEQQALTQLKETEGKCMELITALRNVSSDNAKYKSALSELQKNLEESGNENKTSQKKATEETNTAPEDDKPRVVLRKDKSAVKLKLSELQASLSKKQVGLLNRFLPETFFSQEEDGIQLVILLTGLQDKCEIAINDVQSQFGLQHDIDTLMNEGAAVDQLSFAQYVSCILERLKIGCKNLLTEIEKSDETTYKQLSHSYTDLKELGPALEGLVQVIVEDRLGPAVPLDALNGGLRKLEHLLGTHGINKVTDFTLTNNFVDSMSKTGKALDIELRRLEILFSRTLDGNMDSSFADTVDNIKIWRNKTVEIQKKAKKVNRQLPDAANNLTLKLTPQMRTSLKDMDKKSVSLAVGLKNTGTAVWQHTASSAKSLSVGEAYQLAVKSKVDLSKEAVHVKSAQRQGADESMLPIHAEMAFKEIEDTMESLVYSLERGEFDEAVDPSSNTKEVPMWETRGAMMQAKIAESLSLETALEAKEEEILQERKEILKLKKNISEMKVQLGASLKQVDSTKGDLQRKIEDLGREITATQEELENEKIKGREEANNFEEVCLMKDKEIEDLQKKIQETTEDAASRNKVVDIRSARIKIDHLETSLRAYRLEVAKSRGAQAKASMRELRPLSTGYKLSSTQDDLSQLSLDASKLLREMHLTLASPSVVDITKPKEKAKKGDFEIEKPSAASQFTESVGALRDIQERTQVLTQKSQNVIATELSGGYSGTFSKFLSPSLMKVLDERKRPQKVSEIKIPAALNNSKPCRTALQVTLPELRSIHSAFIP
eukprot:m.48217 g.48217  ORF g.48217 m.48217 type:complete len:1130 (+) comp10557_c0_seq2:354-3743(+)